MALGNIHITPDLVEAVRDAVEILDIASEQTKLKKSGRRHLGLCPLHKEKTPSFSVDSEQGLFYCFGCGQGGDALARRYGIPLPTLKPESGRRQGLDRRLENVLELAEEFFREQLGQHSKPREYLSGREISTDLIDRYRIGYAPPGWRNLMESLGPKIPLRDLERSGLIARSDRRPDEPYDRFRDRLMFPIRNAAGSLVGFGGRTLGDDRAKYLNTSETPRFRKGRILYGLDVAKRILRESRRAFLVEGYFDVLGAAAAGVEGVVASMGTALTPEQSRLLARFTDEVVVGYDGDEAGEKAYRRGLPLLLAQGLAVSRPDMGEGHDPDSVRLDEGPEKLRELVEEAPDAVVREIRRMIPPGTVRDPRAQARAAGAVVELLKAIPDSVLRYGYGKRAADRLGVPVALLLDRLKGRQEAGSAKSGPEGVVRSLEEKTLQLLLGGLVELPPEAELPPVEAFLNPSCRNIYRAFLDLYRSGQGRSPTAREVLARLPDEGDSVDRIARLLLEGSVGSDPRELEGSLYQLKRRWQQQRARELASLIGEAQGAGDEKRLESLLEEKAALSRILHRRD
jgi:DNA primase